MRSVDLKPYDIEAIGPDGKPRFVPYNIVQSLVNVMFAPTAQVQGRDILSQGALAKQIEDAKDEVLLEEEEWNRLKQAVEAFKGYGRNDVELVRRVVQAEKVDAKTKK